MSMFAMIHRQDGENKLPSELDPDGEGVLYGHALAKAWDEVNQIARAIAATSLQKFYYEESEADYDEELYEQLNMAPPDIKEWSDAGEALKTVKALLDFFRRPDRESQSPVNLPPDECDEIVWDLKAYRVILEQASRENQPIRIEIY